MTRLVGALSVVVVVVAASLALVAGCGDDPDPSNVTQTETVSVETQTETVTDAAEESTTESTGEEVDGGIPPADETVSALTGFTSPSGNIGCYIDRRSVRCDIGDRDWEPPPAPADCELDYGQGIELSAGGEADFVCAGDTALGGGQQLPFGRSIAAGLLRCESEESGMTCRDVETGRGFMLAQQGYEIF